MLPTPRSIIFLTCILGMAVPILRADVKMRPGDKPKESTKDFIKDKEKNGYATPEPHDGSANFVSGGRVVVDIEAATSYLGSIKFTIKDPPLYGTLSAITPHPSGESNKAQVVYTHNGNQDQLNDRFTFQAKLSEGNTSAPGTITLIGKRSLPRIEVVEAPRFPIVEPGEEKTVQVVIRNSGTAPYSANIQWPAPFVGPSRLDVGVNEKMNFMLTLKAGQAGAYRLDQELQAGVASSHVQAFVECILPFFVSPSSMVLEFDRATSQRRNIVKVANGSNVPLTLRIDAPARVQVPKEITIPAKESQDLVIALDVQDTALFHGEVWVIQEPHREKVVVHAEPEPAQLKLQSPAESKIDFGKVEKGKSAESTITIANVGGQPAVLKLLSLPAPFGFVKPAEGITIAPGKMEALTVRFSPEQAGDYNNTLTLGGTGGTVSLALRGTMFDPKRPTVNDSAGNPHAAPRPRASEPAPRREAASASPTAKAADAPSTPPSLQYVPPPAAPVATSTPAPIVEDGSAPKGKPDSVAALRSMTPEQLGLQARLASFGFGIESLPMFQSATLDRVPAIGLKEAGPTHIELAWQTPSVEPKQYLVELAEMRRNEKSGLPFKSWKIIENWKPVSKMPDGTAGARIEGLQPNAVYEWRVLGVDDDNKLSPASDILRVTTPAIQSIPLWVWLLAAGSILLVSLLITRRLKEQRSLGV